MTMNKNIMKFKNRMNYFGLKTFDKISHQVYKMY